MAAEPTELSVIPAEIMARTREAWKISATHTARRLIRLDILRGLVRAAHAERSRCLANARPEDATVLWKIELKLESLRQTNCIEDDLSVLLAAPPQAGLLAAGTGHQFPPALLAVIDAEKLNRYDRQWEAALVSEACSVGWHFWTLDAWVDIPRAEEWNTRLTSKLWPSGIVLFVETASLSTDVASRTEGPVPLPLWHGRWTVALRPDLDQPDQLLNDASQWPGYPGAPPSAPTWKLLFAPKTP